MMGTWNTGITANDTAKDLYIEYSAAFYKYDVEEALKRIDHYIRSEMFDETDEEEWCNYYYSLADFMWKKGILTEDVRKKAIDMIDSGFGLELWAEAGQKTLDSRKKKLAEFREKLLSPQPPKKKIKPNVHADRIFEDGDIVAVQLQTAGKHFTEANESALSEEEFHALDGKYVLMQLVRCCVSWTSSIVPEVKDHWARFRLFDGVYDEVPSEINIDSLKDAGIHQGNKLSSTFTCESSMFYFKRRNYRVLCNRKDLIEGIQDSGYCHIFWGVNKPWSNPDSKLVAAMWKQVKCFEFRGSPAIIHRICRVSNRYGQYDYEKTKEENEARFAAEEKVIEDRIDAILRRAGKLYCLSFGPEIGLVTVENGRIDNLYIDGRFHRHGFGTRLLEFAFSVAGEGAYIDVPASHTVLLRVCEKAGLVRKAENADVIRMAKPE